MQAVRKRILEILKRRKSATVGEIARLLGMAPVSVRYHLDILQGDNLIEVSKVRREGSVGRPKQLYSLTDEADEHFPDNYPALTAGLVEQMKKALSPEQLETAFVAVARDMAAELCFDGIPNDAQAENEAERAVVRLDRVVDFLNERGYLARWEKQEQEEATAQPNDQDTFLLHTFNCPYAGVSSEHPELCCMDLELMRELTGTGCQRIDSIAEDGNCCTYTVQIQDLIAKAELVNT